VKPECGWIADPARTTALDDKDEDVRKAATEALKTSSEVTARHGHRYSASVRFHQSVRESVEGALLGRARTVPVVFSA
jgi:hypothetical protein